MKIATKAPLNCLHLDEDSLNNDTNPDSPILDVRNGVSTHAVKAHVLTFIRWYYQLPELTEDMDFLDDIEKQYYARLDGVDQNDVKYGRLFLAKDGSGGLSDRGLTLFLLIQDMTDSMGLDISSSGKDDVTDKVFSAANIKEMQEAFCGVLGYVGLLVNKKSNHEQRTYPRI